MTPYGFDSYICSGHDYSSYSRRQSRYVDSGSGKCEQQSGASGEPEKYIACNVEAAAVVGEAHDSHYNHNHHHHGELARRHSEQHHVCEFDGDHENHHCEQSGKKDKSAHTLAVEHEEE